MKSVATAKKFSNYLSTSATNDEVFTHPTCEGLRAFIRGFSHFTIIKSDYPDYHDEAMSFIENHGRTPEQSLRMLLLLGEFRLAHAEAQTGKSQGSEGEAQNEEEGESTEPEGSVDGDSEAEECDEETIMSKSNADRLIKSLGRDFSYISLLTAKFEELQKGTMVGKVIEVCSETFSRFTARLKDLKDFIKKILDYFGLKGVLLFLADQMKKTRLVEVPVRVVGTILIIALFLTFTVAYPLYRIIKSPIRILKWAAEEVEIDIPVAPDEI